MWTLPSRQMKLIGAAYQPLSLMQWRTTICPKTPMRLEWVDLEQVGPSLAGRTPAKTEINYMSIKFRAPTFWKRSNPLDEFSIFSLRFLVALEIFRATCLIIASSFPCLISDSKFITLLRTLKIFQKFKTVPNARTHISSSSLIITMHVSISMHSNCSSLNAFEQFCLMEISMSSISNLSLRLRFLHICETIRVS